MIRAHRIALEPSNEQRSILMQHADYSRKAFNWGLERMKRGFDEGKWIPAKDLSAAFTQEKREAIPWGIELSQVVPYQALRDLDAALRAWRGKRKDGTARACRNRFPRFKVKGKHDSFRLHNQCVRQEIVDGRPFVRFPKMGLIRMTEALRVEGRLTTATVSITAGRWFVSLTVDDGLDAPDTDRTDGPRIGVDVGERTLITVATDDGGWVRKFQNPKALAGALARLRRTQQSVARSRLLIGVNTPSNRRKAADAKIARLHRRVSDIRRAAQHEATTEIVSQAVKIGAVEIVVEDLNVVGMMSNKRRARGTADAGYAELHRQLRYKAEAAGIGLVEADRFFPSSQVCSACGHQNPEVKKGAERWACPECGAAHDRDINAARNLARWVKEDQSNGGSGPLRRGGRIPLSAGRSSKTETKPSGAATAEIDEPRIPADGGRPPLISPVTAAATPSNDTCPPVADECASAQTQPESPRALAVR